MAYVLKQVERQKGNLEIKPPNMSLPEFTKSEYKYVGLFIVNLLSSVERKVDGETTHIKDFADIWESDPPEDVLRDILGVSTFELNSNSALDFEEYLDFRRYIRDANGRFAVTGGGGSSNEKVRLRSATRQKRQELYDEMSRASKRELVQRLISKKAHTETKETPSETSATKAKKPRKPRLPTLRNPGNIDHVRVEDGQLSIWKNEPNLKRFDPSFRYRTSRDHEYSVTAPSGEQVTLNRHKGTILLKGERVDGVPSLYPRLRETKNQSLFDELARTMTYVEDSKNPPPAPKWKPALHGSIDKSLVETKKGPGEYGEMQLHHVNQWAKVKFDEITQRADKGEITLDQAKALMRANLQPDASLKQGYSIKPQDQADRKLVVLAAGTHDINSPLYRANHPTGIHPDTGKEQAFGIPKKGDGGRESFNEFRGQFWREYYRRESYIAANEINRRIKKGELTTEEAKTMWEAAHGKVVKSRDYIKGLRDERDGD